MTQKKIKSQITKTLLGILWGFSSIFHSSLAQSKSSGQKSASVSTAPLVTRASSTPKPTSATSATSAANEAEYMLVEVKSFETLKTKINFFLSDCKNVFKDPLVDWAQVEIHTLENKQILQVKISGKIKDSYELKIWENHIPYLLEGKSQIEKLTLPISKIPVNQEDQSFVITLSVPMKTQELKVPLQFQKDREVYKYRLRIFKEEQEYRAQALPVLQASNEEFCIRDTVSIGWGISGVIQKQITSPIEANVQLQSLNLNNILINYSEYLNLDKSRKYTLGVNQFNIQQTMNVPSQVSQAFIGSLLENRSQKNWIYKNALFKFKYGYSYGLSLEQREFLNIFDSKNAEIKSYIHGSGTGGFFINSYSQKGNYFGHAQILAEPISFGLNHKYEGWGLRGSVRISKALNYVSAISIESYGHYFQGKRTDKEYSSSIDIFQSQMVFEYTHLF